MKTRQEVIQQLQELHQETLRKLPLADRTAKLTNLLARYRVDHPDESRAWSEQYA